VTAQLATEGAPLEELFGAVVDLSSAQLLELATEEPHEHNAGIGVITDSECNDAISLVAGRFS
jgi:hypothetical protein